MTYRASTCIVYYSRPVYKQYIFLFQTDSKEDLAANLPAVWQLPSLGPSPNLSIHSPSRSRVSIDSLNTVMRRVSGSLPPPKRRLHPLPELSNTIPQPSWKSKPVEFPKASRKYIRESSDSLYSQPSTSFRFGNVSALPKLKRNPPKY